MNWRMIKMHLEGHTMLARQGHVLSSRGCPTPATAALVSTRVHALSVIRHHHHHAHKLTTYQQTFNMNTSFLRRCKHLESYCFKNAFLMGSFHVCVRRLGSLTPNPSKSSSSNSMQRQSEVENQHHSILQHLKKLENSLRFHGYSTIRIGITVFAVIGLSVLYLLREPIRDNVAVEVSQVASRSLEQENVVGKAEEFAKSLLHTLLHDENMHMLAAQFIKQVLNSPETRRASIEYISSILEDPNTRQLLASTIKEVLLLAIHDPETTAALKAAVVVILSDPESQRAARGMISAVFRHEELKDVASVFFAEIMKSEMVVAQATQLGKDVTYQVITDPNLKEETGKSLWQAVKYSVTPSWFSGSPSTSIPSSPTSPSSPSPPPPPSPSTPLPSPPSSTPLPTSTPLPSTSPSQPSTLTSSTSEDISRESSSPSPSPPLSGIEEAEDTAPALQMPSDVSTETEYDSKISDEDTNILT